MLFKRQAQWLQRSQGRAVGGAVLIAVAVVAGAFIRDNRNDDRLGVVVSASHGVTVWSGRPWDGRGRWGISEQEARSATAFGVYWLGPVFAGLHLQVIDQSPPNGAGEFIFTYGTCSADGSSCPVPLSVHSDPICRVGPTPHDSQGVPPDVIGGGAWLRRAGDSYWIWTGDSFLSVNGSAIPEAGIFGALATMNGVAPGGLSAPDFHACPERADQNAPAPSPLRFPAPGEPRTVIPRPAALGARLFELCRGDAVPPG